MATVEEMLRGVGKSPNSSQGTVFQPQYSMNPSLDPRIRRVNIPPPTSNTDLALRVVDEACLKVALDGKGIRTPDCAVVCYDSTTWKRIADALKAVYKKNDGSFDMQRFHEASGLGLNTILFREHVQPQLVVVPPKVTPDDIFIFPFPLKAERTPEKRLDDIIGSFRSTDKEHCVPYQIVNFPQVGTPEAGNIELRQQNLLPLTAEELRKIYKEFNHAIGLDTIDASSPQTEIIEKTSSSDPKYRRRENFEKYAILNTVDPEHTSDFYLVIYGPGFVKKFRENPAQVNKHITQSSLNHPLPKDLDSITIIHFNIIGLPTPEMERIITDYVTSAASSTISDVDGSSPQEFRRSVYKVCNIGRTERFCEGNLAQYSKNQLKGDHKKWNKQMYPQENIYSGIHDTRSTGSNSSVI